MVVFVSGLFKVLHPGHFRFLNYAKRQGSSLVVGLFSDNGHDEIFVSDEDRIKNLKALNFVDDVLLIEGKVEDTLLNLAPDVVVKGWEFRGKYNVEKAVLKKLGSKLVFSPNDPQGSSFDKKEELLLINNSNKSIFEDFEKRRSVTPAALSELLNRASTVKACVFGDIIIDSYINCNAVGMSREDSCIVLRPENQRQYVGGAAIVASHARSLGCDVTFFSIAGDDAEYEFCEKQLSERSINCSIWKDTSRITSKKTRYKVDGKTMSRVNEYKEHFISKELQQKIFNAFKKVVDDTDVVFFCDFGFGLLHKNLVNKIIELCKSKNIFICADSQTSSKLGDLGKFSGADFIAPTEHEARVTVSDYDSGLVELSKEMYTKLGASSVVLTLAQDGILISRFEHSNDEANELNFQNDTLPAFNTSPVDVGGAGDAFFVISSIALVLGGSIWQASYLGSILAGIQVSREGNVPITKNELLGALGL